jgi:hypothetical protein
MNSWLKLLTCAFLLLSPVLSFYDDFQAYNLVSDAGFTSNYTITGGSIAVAPDDSLTLNLTGTTGDYNVYLNMTKANLSYPATFSATLRSNSSFELAVIDTIYSRFSMFIYTNTTGLTTDNLTNSRGYRFDYLVKALDGGIATITLKRCATGLNAYNCGVTLNTTTSNQSLDGFYYTGSEVVNIQDIVFKVTIDSSKVMHFYVNDVLKMSMRDSAETYLSGGLAVGYYSDRSPAFAYIDNVYTLNTSETASSNNSDIWTMHSFPENKENWINYGVFELADVTYTDISYSTTCNPLAFPYCIKTDTWDYTINSTIYCLKGTSLCVPSALTFYKTLPINKKFDFGAYVLKYNDAYFTRTLKDSGVSITTYDKIKAQISGCFYWNSLYTIKNNVPISTSTNEYWSLAETYYNSASGLFIYSPLGFYCTNANNLTITSEFWNTATATKLFEKSIIIPVGYLVYDNGTIDYTIVYDDVLNDSDQFVIIPDNTPPDLSADDDLDTFFNNFLTLNNVALIFFLAISTLIAMKGGFILGIFAFMCFLFIGLMMGLIPLWVGVGLFVIVGLVVAGVIMAVVK